jgi:hypothetical protein
MHETLREERALAEFPPAGQRLKIPSLEGANSCDKTAFLPQRLRASGICTANYWKDN